MKKIKNPGEYDGKPVGAASGIMYTGYGGPKRFSGLRRRQREGSISAQLALESHIAKWLDRGMSPERVADRLGVSWREVAVFHAKNTEFDSRPRLNKRTEKQQ